MTEHIAIVGGGTGGTVLANRLTDELTEEIDAGTPGRTGRALVAVHAVVIH